MPVSEHDLYHDLPDASRDLWWALESWVANEFPMCQKTIKYGTRFWICHGKPLMYLNHSKGLDYIGFVKGHLMQHDRLQQEGRKQIKAFYLEAQEDLPVSILAAIINEAISLNLGK